MICPICQAELVDIGGETWYGYECRKDYLYLEKDYPVCHYAFRHYRDRKPAKEHRYIIYPFVIYSHPDVNESQLYYLYKEGDMSHHGQLHIVTSEYITPDFSNLNPLIEKLNTYLTFL